MSKKILLTQGKYATVDNSDKEAKKYYGEFFRPTGNKKAIVSLEEKDEK